jgi:hypothetical protein
MSQLSPGAIELDDDRVIYSDGRHNAFTSLVPWRGRYWLAFRNGSSHRGHDGRILVVSSPDLVEWSRPTVAIDTGDDDRDPRLVVFDDRLFVAAHTVARQFGDEAHLDGTIHTTRLHSLVSATDDGLTWSEPTVATEPHHFIWWMMARGDHLYATERRAWRVLVDGQQRREYQTSFLRSPDGFRWERVGVISAERLASECAFAFLPDGRAVGFLRHDLDQRPEIVVSDPPYRRWRVAISVPFMYSGPCLGLVAGQIVVSGRAFFEDPTTPLVTAEMRPRQRGLLVATVELDAGRLIPRLMIPHSRGPLGPDDPGADEDARFNAPDISYASVVDLGRGRLAMSYYEGWKGRVSNVRLARLRIG